jgi:hypothetical protein
MSCRRCIPGAGLCPNCTALLARAQGEPSPPMTEAQLQRRVREVTKQLGYLHYHTSNSRKSERGFPDSLVVHPSGGTLWALELKVERAIPTREQQSWLTALRQVTRVEAGVCYPQDLESVVQQFIARLKE